MEIHYVFYWFFRVRVIYHENCVMHFRMVPPKLPLPQKLLMCKISCSFCNYTVIHVLHSAKCDGRNSKIIGFLVYLLSVFGVMCHLSSTSWLVPVSTQSGIPFSWYCCYMTVQFCRSQWWRDKISDAAAEPNHCQFVLLVESEFLGSIINVRHAARKPFAQQQQKPRGKGC